MGIEPASGRKPAPAEPAHDYQIDTAEVSRLDTEVDLPRHIQPYSGPDLDYLLKLSDSRSCQEATRLVVDSALELMKCHEPGEIPFHTHGDPTLNVSRPQQFGDLLYIPETSGALLSMFDLEGDLGAIRTLFREQNLLARMAGGELQCLFGGDLVDRGRQGSQILEFLLDLKFRRGFYDSVHILAGNHELSPEVQMCPRQGGFFAEVAYERRSYADLGDQESDLAKMTLAWHAEHCPHDSFETFPRLRIGLWRLYNELFTRLPKVVLTGNGAVLCHAGPTDKGPFDYIRDPSAHSCPPSFAEAVSWLAGLNFMKDISSEEDIASLEEEQSASHLDYTWSDFSPENSRITANWRRGPGLLFGLDALQSFLDILNKHIMIRGHQKLAPDGAKLISPHVWTAGDRVITINSVLPDGKFRETDNGLVQDFSRQCLRIPLDRRLISVDDVEVIELSGE